MPLLMPMKCWRGRGDCVALASCEATPPDVTEEQFATLEFDPESFVCCGLIKEEARRIPQDAHRLCFKNLDTDEMTDNDEQDLAHLLYVISQALAIIATRRMNEAAAPVMNDEGGMTTVATEQGAGWRR